MKKRYYLGIIGLGALFALGLAGCKTPTTSNSENHSSTPTIEEYTVTWIVDGTSSTETYKEGEMPVFKYGTGKDADNTYTYTFKGWDKELEAVSQDVTYEAVYESTYIDYIYTWVIEGQEIQETYHYGDVPSFKGETPTKEATAQYSYTFTGWDKELTTVTQNETITALFESNVNSYEVTFDVEGVKTTNTYLYGEMPSFEGTPTKAETDQYTYEFLGWDKDVATVTGVETYTAVFEGTLKTYDITWVVGNNETKETYYYGDTPSFKGSTDRESAKYTYTFKGWDKEVETVTGAATYVAQYDEKINKFLVNFYSEDGQTLLDSKEVEYDAIPTFEGNVPTKESTVYHTYAFNGWYNKDMDLLYEGALPEILGAVNYYASFIENARLYDLTIRKLNTDGSLIGTDTVQFGYGAYYTYEAPAIEGKVAGKDIVKGIMEPEKAITIYYSDVSVWDKTSISTAFAGGDGTEANPYIIDSAADLAYLREQVNAGTTYEGVYFRLTKSIDLNGSNFVIGQGATYVFSGVFDGNNCSIRGLAISGTTTMQALFSNVTATGIIKNLSTYGTVSGGQYSGGIVGRNVGGLIENCTNYVNVSHSNANGAGGIAGGTTGTVKNCENYGTVKCLTSGKDKTAGIVGAIESGGSVSYCTNFGNIEGFIRIGGVIGEAQAATALLDNVFNFGTITGAKERIGGIVGQCSSNLSNAINYGVVKSESTATNSYTGGIIGVSASNRTIEYCENKGTVENGVGYSGGIVGCVASNSTTTIKNCTNSGTVTSTGNAVGGIVGGGVASTSIYKVSNCANNGEVKGAQKVGGIAGMAFAASSITDSTNNGKVTSNNLYLGGILGCADSKSSATISGCSNKGIVSSNKNGVGGIVGGTVASAAGLVIENCTNEGEVAGANKVGGIVGAIVVGSDPVNCTSTGTVTGTGALVADIVGSDERE